MSSKTDLMAAAVKYHQAGSLQEAEVRYRQVLKQMPQHADALHLLGVLRHQLGDHQAAIDLIGQAIALHPNATYCFNLGNVYRAMGRLDDAVSAYREALRLNPASADVYSNLGQVYRDQGKEPAAIDVYRQAVRLRPNFPTVQNALGMLLSKTGYYAEGIKHLQLAIKYQPDFPDALNDLGLSLMWQSCGQWQDARRALLGALKLKPDHYMAHSNLLFLLSYHVLCSPEEMLREHREWDRVQGAEGRAHLFQHTAGSGKDKQRLRIGYVSPDFRRHSVSYFFEPLLAQHDRALVEVTCYAEVTRGDAMTERLQGLSDHWCNTAGMSDAQLAQRIHADGIDILVDLAGHTANNRLRAFTFKPAPIQCSYLGYFTTTGLAAMDYWLTDEVLTPADTVEQSSETIYRLPRSCVVYQAPDAAPAVVERPAGGPVTFGSFNDLSKVSAEAVLRWCEILQRVPGSRLLIKARQLAGEEERRVWLGHFAAQGIGAERLILRSRTEGQAEHLAMYGEVDIALDAMPRTGGATTAEALWMGVPVISLAGERFIERLSATMLNAVGLDELVAATATDYVEKAVALAADDERRRALRQGLRARMAASPLCDARGLAHTFETAYRDMWQRWREA
jgi:predicted O-linked N-acetylglucosamine transferase (SPINDLY family)